MTDSLIKTILLQAENPCTKPEEMPELNALLKTNCYGGFFGWSLIGGVEDEYRYISDFIQLNEHAVITRFDAESLLQRGHFLLREAQSKHDKKLAYKTGIYFALVAVYAKDSQKKLMAFQQLAELFAPNGFLPDAALFAQCHQFLAPVSSNNVVYTTRAIIWAWEVTEQNNLLSFEAKRQKLLEEEYSRQPVKKALFLLGLSELDGLNKEKITAAGHQCVQRWQEMSGLSAEEAAIHPLIKCFNEAQKLLLDYLTFREFTHQHQFQTLEQLLLQTKTADSIDDLVFDKAYQLIREFEVELDCITKIACLEPPYITEEMITARLGVYVADYRQYELQVRLCTLAQNYWDELCMKTMPLISTAKELLSSHASVAERISAFVELGTRLEQACVLVAHIRAHQLHESSWGFSRINNVTSQWNEISPVMERVKQQILFYKALVRLNISDLIVLHERLMQNETNSCKSADINQQESLIAQINAKLDWLRQLNGMAKSMVEHELKNQVLLHSTPYKSLESMIQNLKAYKEKLTLSAQQLSGQLNEVLQQEINALLPLYIEANFCLDACCVERNSMRFLWEKKWSEFLKMQQTLHKAFAQINKKIPVDYTQADYITPITSVLISRLKQQQIVFEQRTIEVKQQIEAGCLDTFNYLFLKNRLNDELNQLENQTDVSFEKFREVIDEIDCNDTGERVALFVQCVKVEQREMTDRRTCLGGCTVSPLHRLFSVILKEAEHLNSFALQLRWGNRTLSLDALCYMRLKNKLAADVQTYLASGNHHQDRKESITRLMLKINELDRQQGSHQSRFFTLFKTLKNEETATIQSHLRTGFFPTWHACRLQKLYGDVLLFAEQLQNIIPNSSEMLILHH